LRKTRRGTLVFNMQHQGLEPSVNQLTNTAQRIALVFLSAAMMLTAAILRSTAADGVMWYVHWYLLITGGLIGTITFFAILRNFRR
jgi:hypothetical protein